MLIALGIFSVLVGFIIGASGVGGVLLIPLLVYCGGLSMHEAMASALFSFFFTGIAATLAYQRQGSIDWGITLPIIGGSFFTSFVGARLGAGMEGRSLTLILSVLIILTSAYALRPGKAAQSGRKSLRDKLREGRGRFPLLLGLGLLVGFLCGLTGIGGGIVSIPLMLLLGFSPLSSIAASQVLQSIVAVSGSASNIANHFVVFQIIWWVTCLEFIGVGLGARLAHTLPEARLKTWVSALCLALGMVMLIRSV